MGIRAVMLLLCVVGLFAVFFSLEYWLIEYTPLVALGLYSIGLIAFVFGAKGVLDN